MIHRITQKFVSFGLGLGLIGVMSCSSSSPAGGPDAPTGNPADAPASSAAYSHYVTNDLTIGKTPADALALAFNLDNDPQGKPDNALGGILVGLNIALGVDINSALTDALTMGEFVILHSVHGNLTSDTNATWQIYLGDPKSNPDLTSGNGMFTIASSSPTNSIYHGKIVGGLFSGGPAQITIQLALIPGASPITVNLVASLIEAQVTATGCMAGRIGGGIKNSDLKTVVIPAIASALTSNYQNHGCPSGTACTANDKAIFATLDMNHDGVLTADEIMSYGLVAGALAPDVHLLDSNTSGPPDSNSIAFGFGCSKAVFTAPNEH